MNTDLKNKVVIVTGVTGGIGKSICFEFLAERSIVYGVYRGNADKLNEISDWVNENKQHEGKFYPLLMDITSKDSVTIGIQRILDEHKKIDVLVNCAGFSFERPFQITDEDEWNKIIEINLSVPARLCRHVLKPMFKEKSGAIVNVSSILSTRFGRGNVAYASAKAALNRFTQALASEVGLKGIRVNAVCPGVIETKMSTGLNMRFGDLLKEATPLQRNGKPEDIAKAVVFLSSQNMAGFITGATLNVDGGRSI